MGNYQGAISDYNKAIEIDPQYALAYNIRGLLKGMLGDFKGGCLDLRKASSLGSEDATKLLNQFCQ